MKNQRGLYRIAVELNGEIRRGLEATTCTVVNVTEKGIQFKTALPVNVGETVQLTICLTSICTIHVAVLITRANQPDVGACISDISLEDQQRLSQFIEQLNELNLTGF